MIIPISHCYIPYLPLHFFNFYNIIPLLNEFQFRYYTPEFPPLNNEYYSLIEHSEDKVYFGKGSILHEEEGRGVLVDEGVLKIDGGSPKSVEKVGLGVVKGRWWLE